MDRKSGVGQVLGGKTPFFRLFRGCPKRGKNSPFFAYFRGQNEADFEAFSSTFHDILTKPDLWSDFERYPAPGDNLLSPSTVKSAASLRIFRKLLSPLAISKILKSFAIVFRRFICARKCKCCAPGSLTG